MKCLTLSSSLFIYLELTAWTIRVLLSSKATVGESCRRTPPNIRLNHFVKNLWRFFLNVLTRRLNDLLRERLLVDSWVADLFKLHIILCWTQKESGWTCANFMAWSWSLTDGGLFIICERAVILWYQAELLQSKQTPITLPGILWPQLTTSCCSRICTLDLSGWYYSVNSWSDPEEIVQRILTGDFNGW